MYKNLKNYFLILMVFPVFAMKRSSDELLQNTPGSTHKKRIDQSGNIIKTEPITSPAPGLTDDIKDILYRYNQELKQYSTEALMMFRDECYLTPENWQLFIREANMLESYKEQFSAPPLTFQQSIDSHIPQAFIQKLKNNCQRNGICFEKINIVVATEGPAFAIQTPLYMPCIKAPSKFIFRPDILTLNLNEYKKHADFFNVCIVAALKREIMRIVHIFNLIFQQQVVQAIQRESHYLRCFDFSEMSQINKNVQQHVKNFMRYYGFRVGILRLALKHKGVANVFVYYLTHYPELCARYGILQENYSFFEYINSLDSSIQLPLEKSPHACVENDKNDFFFNDPFFQENEPLCLSTEDFLFI